jgi:hypothetical protein
LNPKPLEFNTCNKTNKVHKTLDKKYLLQNKLDCDRFTEIVDTITNWQFYKDSELLFKSNIADSNRFTATIKTTENYDFLSFKIFYDFNNEITDRRIEFTYNHEILLTLSQEGRSSSSFLISKAKIDAISDKNIGKDLQIIYTDKINQNGIIVGILKIVD